MGKATGPSEIHMPLKLLVSAGPGPLYRLNLLSQAMLIGQLCFLLCLKFQIYFSQKPKL